MYYLTINGQTVGPMTPQQLMAYDVNSNTPVSCDGGPWQPLYTFPELMQMLHNRNHYAPVNPELQSKRVLCGIMAIIFGALGVQYFIMGKVAAGFITILLSICTCGAWELITFIQGILMLCMSDEEFNRKYMMSTKTLPLF